MRHTANSVAEEERHELGLALLSRADEVIVAVNARARRRRERHGEQPLDRAIEESFERLGTISTLAVGRWLAGEPAAAAASAGREFSALCARMVASGEVALADVIRSCRYWRDACEQIVTDAGAKGLAGEGAVRSTCELLKIAADRALGEVGVIFDAERRRIEAELEQRRQELAFLATHDPLTGLANRALLEATIQRLLGVAKRHGGQVAVLFMDLDDFKLVNDTLGHDVGDRLLVAIAQRLRRIVREGETLARLGGDEFVITAGDEDGVSARRIADRLHRAFASPFTIDEWRSLSVSASIGFTRGGAGSSVQELLGEADRAMYSMKRRRRGDRWRKRGICAGL